MSHTAGEPVTLPLSSVRRMEIHELDVSKTITAIVVPLGAIVAAIGMAMVAQAWNESP